MSYGLKAKGDLGILTIVAVAIFNSVLHLFLVYGVFYIFDLFFKTPWSRA